MAMNDSRPTVVDRHCLTLTLRAVSRQIWIAV